MDYSAKSTARQYNQEDGQGGLFTCHISPKRLFENNILLTARQYSRWEKTKKRVKDQYKGENLPGIYCTAEGSYLRVTSGGSPKACKRSNFSSRGIITNFTRGARRRLSRRLAMIKRSTRPLFITLTYPDDSYQDTRSGKVIKRNIDNLIKRMARSYPGVGGVWKLEYIDRKSGIYTGQLFPHFHMLLYGYEGSLADLRLWLSDAWYQIVGSGNPAHKAAGTQIKQTTSNSQITLYISKYIAKETQITENNLLPGRFWAFFGIDNIPWDQVTVYAIDHRSALDIMRYMKRYIKRGGSYPGLTIITNVARWIEVIPVMLWGDDYAHTPGVLRSNVYK